MTHHYTVYGESLASEIELGMLEPCSPSAVGWSVRIAAESEPGSIDWYHTIGGNDEDGVVRYGSAGGYHFVKLGGLPTVGISTAAKELVAFVRAPVSRATMTHLIVDQALPLAIAHSGRIVLHTSCVARGDVAIAFVGPSGSGKSTIAAAFCRRGWQLVSDDALAFRSVSPPVVDAAYSSVRLWRESLRGLGEDDPFLPRVVEGMDKRLLALPRSAAIHTLRRIHLVEPMESAAAHAIRHPALGETMTGIAACSFRLDTRDRDRLASEFDALFQLSRACPISILEVARGYDRIASLTELLEADLAAE